MSIRTIGDCSDLYDNAVEELKRLDHDIDKIIQDLANKVEARGVPKNKVARQVVKELTAREVLSPTRIYEGLGIENKRKYVKKSSRRNFSTCEKIV
jgi:mRNA-degrading endonuclease RelE of RelBE toxin-antitoxin system